ncbi:MAG: MmgE/PrpD family protein [Betaproteobacteria bacterium]|nr:MmgE/PrpD family protein [Betaproteobacteria bacterium]
MLPSAASYRESPPEYLLEVSHFICNTRFEDLPPAVVDRARRLIADLLGIVTAGNQSDELKAFASTYLEGSSTGASWVIGTKHRASARDAGFLNGIASTWHDFDEGSTIAYSHPGSQTIPAAFAAAQALGISGRDLLLAIVMGYEACARVGMASKMRVSVHPHGTTGTIGSAVAIARMKGFDEARMRQVINVAATMAMTTNRQAMLDEATVRNMYSGHSALAGATAVQLVQAGFTGQRDGIGFTYGTVIADGFDPQRYVSGLGRDWLILQGYFKLHPSGRYSHAAIDALESALATVPGGKLDIDQIERIDVRAFQMAALLAGTNITTSFGAKFSIPFALATILVHGRSAVECFDLDAVRNPRVQALVAKIDVREEPAYTKAYPGRQICDLAIHLRDGSAVRGRCEVMKGEPANPHRAEDVEKKYFDLMSPVWGADRARKLYDAILALEEVADMREFADRYAL